MCQPAWQGFLFLYILMVFLGDCSPNAQPAPAALTPCAGFVVHRDGALLNIPRVIFAFSFVLDGDFPSLVC